LESSTIVPLVVVGSGFCRTCTDSPGGDALIARMLARFTDEKQTEPAQIIKDYQP
jgi:hypothetical protein